jgi:hypothetical protein
VVYCMMVCVLRTIQEWQQNGWWRTNWKGQGRSSCDCTEHGNKPSGCEIIWWADQWSNFKQMPHYTMELVQVFWGRMLFT